MTPLFSVFAAVLVVETLNALFLGTPTALTRHRLKQYINKEDADLGFPLPVEF